MLWNNDEVQFARLICEIRAAEELLNWSEIRDSMDLKDEELQELFDRAEVVFEAAKAEADPATRHWGLRTADGESATELWEELGNTPIDSEERIEMPFKHFPVGTHREDIWEWFENTFSVRVIDLMFPKGKESDNV